MLSISEILDQYLLLIIPVCATVFCFAPLFFNKDLVSEDSSFEKALLHSDLVEISFASIIAACVPMLTDLALDLCARSNVHFYFFERFFTLFGLIIPSVAYFALKGMGIQENFGDIYTSFTSVQTLWVAMALISIVTDSTSGIWTFGELYWMYALFCVRTILFPFLCFDDLSCLGVVFVAWLSALISFLWYLGVFVRYIRHIWVDFDLSKGEYLPLVNATFILLFSLSLILRGAIWRELTVNEGTEVSIVVGNIAVMFLAVIGTIMPGRAARAQIKETERMLELKQSFVRYISHEIRTPMNVASIGLAILEHNLRVVGFVDAETAELLVQVKDSIFIATEILNDLLLYETLNSNMMTLETSVEKPIKFIRNTLNLFVLQARNADVVLTLPSSRNSPAILRSRRLHIDTFKLSQVLRNFASNALKFTPKKGTITVGLEVSSRPRTSEQRASKRIGGGAAPIAPTDEWLVIKVVDTGVGISKENLPKVFKEMVQFNANELQGGKGTGLGLYISKGIVELHGGRVYVKSEGLQKGCTFCIELPLFTLEQSQSKPVSSADLTGEDSLRRSRVLSNSSFKPISMQSLSCDDDIESGRKDSAYSGESASMTDRSRPGNAGNPRQGGRVLSDTVVRANMFLSRGISNEHYASVRYDSDSDDDAETGVRSPRTQRASCWGSDFSALRSEEGEAVGGTPGSHTGRDPAHLAHIARDDVIDLTGKNVLLVDDSEVSLKIITLLFKKFGATCETATDGAKAVELVRKSLACNAPSMVAAFTFSPRNSNAAFAQPPLVLASSGDASSSAPTQSQQASHISSFFSSLSTALVGDGDNENSSNVASPERHPPNVEILNLRGLRQRDCNSSTSGTLVNPTPANPTSVSSDEKDAKAAVPTFDLILMDNWMPVMSGAEACRVMRSMGFRNAIYGLTGNAQQSDVSKFVAAGADHVFRKPFDINEFQRVLALRRTAGAATTAQP